MSQCIQCGRESGEELLYACVLTETETIKPEGEKYRKRITRETLTDIIPKTVCPECARKAKMKAVLMTIPITLILTVVMTFFSLFAVKPNRNIRKEVAAWPTVVPFVAVIVWLCGLSVYLPKPKELYTAEIVRKRMGLPNNSFLLPLDQRCYTCRKSGVLKPVDITHRTPTKTELAEKIIPVIQGEADEADLRALIGQTFVKEENAR